jgi:hypothetical protein
MGRSEVEGLGGVDVVVLFWDMDSRFIRSWIGSGCLDWAGDSNWGIFEGAVTERWLPTEAAGGEF